MQYTKWLIPAAVVFCALSASAQQSKPAAVDDAFVQKEFGSTCKLVPGPQPMVADLDGDSVEDIVLVAHCTNPLLDQADKNFQLIDPYNTFFGYGDTRITTELSLIHI